MQKFPFSPQFDNMDCGSACIKMVSDYYGNAISFDYLRDLCYTTKEGVSLLSISDAMEKIGYKTLGGKITLKKLTNEAPLPCILHWNQEHFVVLYNVEKSKFNKQNQYLVADPGEGLVKYNEDEFKDKWLSTNTSGQDKGLALLFEPTTKFFSFEKRDTQSHSFKFLFKYVLKYRRLFTQLILGLLIGSLIQLIFPFLTQSLVDIGIKNQNLSFIYLILIAQLVLFFSRMSVEFIRRWLLLHISIRINISLVSDFLIKLMKLPMTFFDTKMLGDIVQRMKDYERIESFLTSHSLSILFSFFNLVIFAIVLGIYSLKIFIIFLLGSILYTSWVFIFLKKRKELDYKLFEQQSKNQSYTYQMITGMQEMKLQNCEKRKRWEWEDIQADMFGLNIKALSLEQSQEAGNIFINELKNIIITIFAATAVINGEITLGMMLAIQYIIGQLNSPIEQTVRFIHSIQDVKISLERINEIRSKKDEDEDKMDYEVALKSNEFEIKNLLFQYEGPHSPKVLENINLTIPQKKVTAIVGASGSGKTTLIKLLLKYYKPVAGEILVDDNNLIDFNSTWWRNNCGAVMQDGFIFTESIARNIACSNDEIDTDRLLYAAKTANIHKFIQSLPLKYNTIIGNDGQNLSQGQKQRILIARAVYKNPDFLFFDEATNALDANNEKAIVENLQEFYKNKTVVIVAHRLSTVKNADQIVVLDNGKIIEVGNHEELVSKKGAYFNLVKNQLELGN